MSEDPARPPSHADWLRLIGSRLDPTLVPAVALESWLDITRLLPADGPAVLEVALGPKTPQWVDFSWRLTDPRQAASVTSVFRRHTSLDFLRLGWSALGHPEPIPAVWLELDGPWTATEAQNLPMVIPRLDRPVDPAWLAHRLAPALGIAAAEDPGFRAFVERATAVIPAPGRVLYVFCLAARGLEGLRLETIGLPVSSMMPLLEDLDGFEAARQIEAVAHLADGVDRPHLSFDIEPATEGGRVGERVGLELGFRRQPDREPGWNRLLRRLERAGLCTADQRRALLAWCGTEHLRSAGDRWPTGARGHCVCCLSHLKLVTAREAPPAAKAYLLFQNFVPTRRTAPESVSGAG